MNLKSNYLWMLSSKIMLIVSSLATASMINRTLGPASRGVYAEMQTWVAMLMAIMGLSLDTAIYHFTKTNAQEKDEANSFMTTIVLSLIYSLLSIIVFQSMLFFIPGQFTIETHNYAFLLFGWLTTLILSNNFSVFFQARNKIIESSTVGFIQALLNFILISLVYFTNSLNLMIIVVVTIIVQIMIIMFYLYLGKRSKILPGRFSHVLALGMFKVGLKQHAGTVSTFIYTKVNQLIVIKYCGQVETGLYAVALNLALSLMIIPSTLQLVLYPRVIYNEDEYSITTRIINLSFYLWGGCVVLGIIFTKPLLYLYGGSAFYNADTMLKILMITVWLMPLSSMVAPYCIKSGAFLAMSLSAVILGILSISLNWYLVPIYGGVGAAIATAFSSLTGFCFSLILLTLLAKKAPWDIFDPKLLFNSLAIALNKGK